jgi:hypothetical protein
MRPTLLVLAFQPAIERSRIDTLATCAIAAGLVASAPMSLSSDACASRFVQCDCATSARLRKRSATLVAMS